MKAVLKRLYKALPFKKQLFSGFRLIPLPVSISRHLHFEGVFRLKLDAKTSVQLYHGGTGFLMESDLFWKGFGGDEYYSMQVWRTLAQQSRHIADIGANSGVYAVIACATQPQAQVVGVEPLPFSFSIVEKNKAVNQLKQLTLVQAAIGAADGQATLYTNAGKGEHDYYASLHADQTRTGIPVKVLTFQTLLQQLNWPALDLVKIDVEGAEPEVIKGMKQDWPNLQPVLLVEILTAETGRTLEQVIQVVPCRYFYIDEKKGLKPCDALWTGLPGNYLIVPESRQTLTLNELLQKNLT